MPICDKNLANALRVQNEKILNSELILNAWSDAARAAALAARKSHGGTADNTDPEKEDLHQKAWWGLQKDRDNEKADNTDVNSPTNQRIAAHYDSRRAWSTGNLADHELAAKEHHTAATTQESLGNHAAASQHDLHATEHDNEVSDIRNRYGLKNSRLPSFYA
jgi:hypothetical protein